MYLHMYAFATSVLNFYTDVVNYSKELRMTPEKEAQRKLMANLLVDLAFKAYSLFRSLRKK